MILVKIIQVFLVILSLFSTTRFPPSVFMLVGLFALLSQAERRHEDEEEEKEEEEVRKRPRHLYDW